MQATGPLYPGDKVDYDIGADEWLDEFGDGDSVSSCDAAITGQASIAATSIHDNVIKIWVLVDSDAVSGSADLTVHAVSALGRRTTFQLRIRIRG